MHDTKVGVIVRDDLKTWQKLNVTAFLSAGIAANAPDSIGQEYEDGSGNTYLSTLNQPVFVYMATGEHMHRTRTRALHRNIPLALYTKDMFVTDNDVDNRAVVKAMSAQDLDIVGLVLRAERKAFDKIISGLKLHS